MKAYIDLQGIVVGEYGVRDFYVLYGDRVQNIQGGTLGGHTDVYYMRGGQSDDSVHSPIIHEWGEANGFTLVNSYKDFFAPCIEYNPLYVTPDSIDIAFLRTIYAEILTKTYERDFEDLEFLDFVDKKIANGSD